VHRADALRALSHAEAARVFGAYSTVKYVGGHMR
jgi:hypothetical protein